MLLNTSQTQGRPARPAVYVATGGLPTELSISSAAMRAFSPVARTTLWDHLGRKYFMTVPVRNVKRRLRAVYIALIAIVRLSRKDWLPLSPAESALAQQVYDRSPPLDSLEAIQSCLAELMQSPTRNELEADLSEVRFLPGLPLQLPAFLRLMEILKKRWVDTLWETADAVVAFTSLGGQPNGEGAVDPEVIRAACQAFDLEVDMTDLSPRASLQPLDFDFFKALYEPTRPAAGVTPRTFGMTGLRNFSLWNEKVSASRSGLSCKMPEMDWPVVINRLKVGMTPSPLSLKAAKKRNQSRAKLRMSRAGLWPTLDPVQPPRERTRREVQAATLPRALHFGAKMFEMDAKARNDLQEFNLAAAQSRHRTLTAQFAKRSKERAAERQRSPLPQLAGPASPAPRPASPAPALSPTARPPSRAKGSPLRRPTPPASAVTPWYWLDDARAAPPSRGASAARRPDPATPKVPYEFRNLLGREVGVHQTAALADLTAEPGALRCVVPFARAAQEQRVRSQQLSTLAAEVLNALPTTSYHFPPVFSMLE